MGTDVSRDVAKPSDVPYGPDTNTRLSQPLFAQVNLSTGRDASETSVQVNVVNQRETCHGITRPRELHGSTLSQTCVPSSRGELPYVTISLRFHPDRNQTRGMSQESLKREH